jgi:hypothetical protein
MVPISEVNVTHWCSFSGVNLELYSYFMRSNRQQGVMFCGVEKT